MPSLLYSKLLHAKLCLFVFDGILTASHWHIISICNCFVASFCNLSGLVTQMRGQRTINLLVVESIPPQKTFFFSILITRPNCALDRRQFFVCMFMHSRGKSLNMLKFCRNELRKLKKKKKERLCCEFRLQFTKYISLAP